MERCGIKDVDEETMAMVASAFAQQAMVTENKAAAFTELASSSSSKEEEEEEEEAASKEEELAAVKQAEGREFQKEAAATGVDCTGSEDDEGEVMTSLEYMRTYKLLPPAEVELILPKPLERRLFTDSYVYKALCADPDVKQEDITSAYEEHEAQQDMKMEFGERVRSEYEANGYVTVSDEYIAMRVRNEELSNRLWEEAFADYDDDDDEVSAAAEDEDESSSSSSEVAASKQTESKEFQKEVAATVVDDTDSEDEEDEMTSLEYIKTYKELPPHEVELILKKPLERTPFTDSYAFKALSADPKATREDIALAYEEHEEEQDIRMEFRQRVRSEYEANGYVTVSDEYIAMRVRNDELAHKLWDEAFAGYDDEVAGFRNEVDVEEEDAH